MAQKGPKDWSPVGVVPFWLKAQWQEAYGLWYGKTGKVKNVFLRADYGSIRLWVQVERNDGRIVYYRPATDYEPTNEGIDWVLEDPEGALVAFSKKHDGLSDEWKGPYKEPV